MMARVFDALRAKRGRLAEEVRALAEQVLANEARADEALARVAKRRIDAQRIRIHGDYHLGQVLWTGDDFVIIDFEGEPARPLPQRRIKYSPLRDVAGMLRSYRYASAAALRDGRLRVEDVGAVAPWAIAWAEWASASYLVGYLDQLKGSSLIPASPGDVATLLAFYQLEKCVYEIGYELDSRPDWLEIPIRGLLSLIEGPG
jgi:maltose alpha-D-glucosyltransferase/alpha-amylase